VRGVLEVALINVRPPGTKFMGGFARLYKMKRVTFREEPYIYRVFLEVIAVVIQRR
jgi:hypothetical protein